jgi:hypothetical protein
MMNVNLVISQSFASFKNRDQPIKFKKTWIKIDSSSNIPASTRWSSIGNRFLTLVETMDNIMAYDDERFTYRMIGWRIKRQRLS